ncbi:MULTISPECIES: SO_0444 family Cu/Zn efflux transporter [Pseudoalteromonas]|uniref:SO_0444 family Cu/Zn efflux transporter n=1 Tax=Pseudoalteromonas TaxID=53246 RepID=UPI001581A033|nr:MULTISPECIES: SO_0444 family Cu/Zn efflux transporter [Pseudoalteromonas]MDI4651369.1 SO_0444 family Cu/Zn efflux transporter [Pseudoalteromonas shioyasakiensis]NUJ37700.1 SO_0444 family Cu/Zn efflux transporter [Pseudoalteromonas sp. 0303]
MDLLNNFWHLFLLSAPWLMLGLFIAGLLNVYLPANFLNRHLGKEGLWTTVKAAFIGAPMPLCSCGVIPAAIGLRRAGASKSATTAFLVSTPETGVDSVSVSYVLLGPFMAVIRPIAAVCSAIVAGVLVGKDSELHQVQSSESDQESTKKDSCCSSKQPEPMTTSSCCSKEAPPKPEQSCCSKQTPKEPESVKTTSCCSTEQSTKAVESRFSKLKRAVSFSCNKLLEDTMIWLMIGLFFAALVQTYVPESYLSQWGNGILAMLVVILISIPMYICATASTPIAAGLLLSGVSPGAVLVFMLAGPATNIATLGVVGKELGKRAVFAYLIGVIGTALAFGFLTDYLVAQYGFVVAPMMGEEHEVLPHWLSLGAGIVLAILMLRLLLKMVLKKASQTGKSIA